MPKPVTSVSEAAAAGVGASRNSEASSGSTPPSNAAAIDLGVLRRRPGMCVVPADTGAWFMRLSFLDCDGGGGGSRLMPPVRPTPLPYAVEPGANGSAPISGVGHHSPTVNPSRPSSPRVRYGRTAIRRWKQTRCCPGPS
ncbi:hypothetical protein GCM10009680_33500 [Streptomyces yatensis]|uniref:Uncharacterized protein n=1 Tax=Streptomyces yatensis TaxID=155177 RepID=A0ABN2HQE0_9ACTN